MIKALIYARVSKRTMFYDRQISDLEKWASDKSIEVVEVVTEKISGGLKTAQREGLQRVLQLGVEKKFNLLIISELSRLGRTSDVLSLIERLNELKINLFVHNIGLYSLDEENKPSPIVSMFLGMLSSFNFAEKTVLSQRIVSGLNQAKKEGKILGRRKDSFKSRMQYLIEYKSAIRLIKRNLSLREVATIEGISINTVRRLRNVVKAAA